MRGQRTVAIPESAADSIPLRVSFQTIAITKPRGPKLALALTIHHPAAEIDLLCLKMLAACRENRRPVALAASSSIRDAMIQSSLLRSREAKATLVLHLARLLPV